MSSIRDRYPDLPTLLAAIRKRPGMFLGHQTVCGLHLLLQGFFLAEDFHDVPSDARLGGFDFEAFEKWIEARFNPQHLSVRSYWLAERLAGDEETGFDLWFRWYDEFTGLDARGIDCPVN